MIMRCVVAALSLGLVCASWGHGGPVDGPFARNYEIGAMTGDEPTPKDFIMKFRGGERACVIARGDHKPVVGLDLTIYDATGTEVARDESAKDFVAVFWVPPRTAEYRIVVRNHGREYNDVYVVFK
jgi:hypothetical protein